MDLAKLVKEHFIDPELEETHLYFGSLSVLAGSTEMEFVEHVKVEAASVFERVRHRLQLGPAEIRSVDVSHEERVKVRKVVDPVTQEEREEEETWHDFALTFHCSGRPNRAPLAAALAKFDRWLLVDRVQYLECGMLVDTPAGPRRVIVIDAVHNMVKLDGDAGCSSFPLYPVGDCPGIFGNTEGG